MSERVAVVGAGTMGSGIAQVAAAAGFEVTLHDVSEAVLTRARDQIATRLEQAVAKGKLLASERDLALGHLTLASKLTEAVRDASLVVEAVLERLPLKHDVFRSLVEHTPAHAILASNTSSISIASIAAAVPDPGRVVGMHFFNPPYAITLLELVHAPDTSEATITRARAFAEAMGRDVIVVKDSPGFATSRLGIVLGLEAIRMVEQGVASAADIDKAMEKGYRHAMGPLKTGDLVGLDTRLDIAGTLYAQLKGEQYRPPELLRRMVQEGKLGKKSGQGFYRW